MPPDAFASITSTGSFEYFARIFAERLGFLVAQSAVRRMTALNFCAVSAFASRKVLDENQPMTRKRGAIPS